MIFIMRKGTNITGRATSVANNNEVGIEEISLHTLEKDKSQSCII